MFELLLFLIFPFLLVLAGSQDLLTMTISNKISLALIGGFCVFAYASGMDLNTFAWHWALFGIVLALVITLFALNVFGGGDAKIIACVSLWFGWEHTALYILLFSIYGGMLAYLLAMFRSSQLHPRMITVSWVEKLHKTNRDMPYGVALAAAALQVYPQTDWLKFLVSA